MALQTLQTDVHRLYLNELEDPGSTGTATPISVVHCGNDHGQANAVLHVHLPLLATRCPKLYGEIQTHGNAVEHVDLETLTDFVSYVYTDHLCFDELGELSGKAGPAEEQIAQNLKRGFRLMLVRTAEHGTLAYLCTIGVCFAVCACIYALACVCAVCAFFLLCGVRVARGIVACAPLNRLLWPHVHRALLHTPLALLLPTFLTRASSSIRVSQDTPPPPLRVGHMQRTDHIPTCTHVPFLFSFPTTWTCNAWSSCASIISPN